jgi:spoIIIJ-associated protein
VVLDAIVAVARSGSPDPTRQTSCDGACARPDHPEMTVTDTSTSPAPDSAVAETPTEPEAVKPDTADDTDAADAPDVADSADVVEAAHITDAADVTEAGAEEALADEDEADEDEDEAEAEDEDGSIDDSVDDDAESAGEPERPAPDSKDLFRESEIAADYVEGLLDILDYDGDIDELINAGRPVVEVVGGRLQSLVGQRGATLEALQELTRLAVFRQTGAPSRLLLDVGGYRATRRKELGAVAKNAAEKVKEYGEPVKLEPMSAFERKCVHDVINALAGVESESEGVEPARRIVVRPTA